MPSIFKFFVTAFATLAYFRVLNLDVSFFIIFFALPPSQFIFAFTRGGPGSLKWGGWGYWGLVVLPILLFFYFPKNLFYNGLARMGDNCFCQVKSLAKTVNTKFQRFSKS